MTFEEIVEYYTGFPWWAGKAVYRRAGLAGTNTYTGGCMCGWCGNDAAPCVCGADYVQPHRKCRTCGRPWWCER